MLLLYTDQVNAVDIIGKVFEIKGDVLTKSYATKELHYLQKGDVLPLETFIITKPGSSLTIKTYHQNIIKIKSNTQMTLKYSKEFKSIMARVLEGQIFYETNLNNKPNLFISGKNKKNYYTARSFIFKKQNKEYRFIKKGKGKIISLSKKDEISGQKEDLIIPTVQKSTDEFAGIFSEDTATDSVASVFDSAIETTIDKSTQAPIKEEKKEKVSALTLKFISKSTFYFQKPNNEKGNIDKQFFHQDVKLTLTDSHKINHDSSLNFNIFLEASNRKHLYNDFKFPQNMQSPQRDYFYVNEFYYTHTSENYDFQIGKKILKLGKGIAYSPTDSITASDVSVPTSPVYLGNYVISLDYYKDDWTFSFIYFPIVTPNKSAAQNSRWSVLYNDINFNLNQELENSKSITKRPILIKAEGTKFGTDWMFAFYNGANPTPAIRNDITVEGNTPTFNLVQEYVPITFISSGFSTVFAGLELHGEVLLQNAKEGRDDSFLAQMLGTRYTMDSWPKILGLDNIDLIFEYGKETLREAQTKPYYASSSLQTRIYQNSFLGSIILNFTQRASVNYDFHIDNKNNGSASVLSFNYASHDSGQFRVKAELYSGDPESIFGIWDNNDNVSFEYNYTF
jgi:hypothetical protein